MSPIIREGNTHGRNNHRTTTDTGSYVKPADLTAHIIQPSKLKIPFVFFSTALFCGYIYKARQNEAASPV